MRKFAAAAASFATGRLCKNFIRLRSSAPSATLSRFANVYFFSFSYFTLKYVEVTFVDFRR